MPAQFPGIGYVADGPVSLARKICNNTALMAEAFPGGIIPSLVTVPANSSAPGAVGDMAVDGSYLYVAVAANTWRRTPIDDWT